MEVRSHDTHRQQHSDGGELRSELRDYYRWRRMKSRLMLVAACLMLVMPGGAGAQAHRTTRANAPGEPPRLPLHAFANSQPDGVIASLFAFQPVIPLGPVDVLKGYEDGMTLIVLGLSNDLVSISRANQADQITRNEAEYLIRERYQMAIMQHEVLSALHDSLQHDIAQAAQSPGTVSQSDTAVVVQPPWSEQVRTQ
jgi:hypothetical protein